jgi:WD40 repeat protein
MTIRIFRNFAFLAFTALALQAQTSQISGPVSGYVFDGAARALRPILGIPGASLLGDPVNFGFDITSAFVAPRQDAAFVIASDQSVHLFRIDSGAVTERPVDSLAGAPQRVIFSPSGTAAALYAGGSIEVVKGLPGSPAVAGGFDLSPGAKFDSLALSDDGAVLLVSADNTVRLFGSFADLGKLTDTAGPVLMAFAAGGHDAAVADPAGAGIMLFHDLTGAGDSQLLAATDDTIAASSALAFSSDGKSLLLASSAGQSITTFDLAAGARNAIACSCAPTVLTRMGSVFRLTELGSDPLWLLDTRAPDARIVFVPALAQ